MSKIARSNQDDPEHIADSFRRIFRNNFSAFMENEGVGLGAIRASLESMQTDFTNTRKILEKLMEGTEDWLPYFKRLITCESYIEIVRRSAEQIMNGEPPNLFACANAASAFEAEFEAITATMTEEVMARAKRKNAANPLEKSDPTEESEHS